MRGWRAFAAVAVCLGGVAAGGQAGAGATGPIGLSVDLRDAPKKIVHATETIPVGGGADGACVSGLDSGRAYAFGADR